jgi:hypothetical protein
VASAFFSYSSGQFTFTDAGIAGPIIVEPGEAFKEAMWAATRSGFLNLDRFDQTPRDGVVTDKELAILYIYAVDGAQTAWNDTSTPPDGAHPCRIGAPCFRGLVSGFTQHARLDLMAHELMHLLGNERGLADIYGTSCHSNTLSVMSCSSQLPPRSTHQMRNAYHPDPYAKMLLGWTKPRLVSPLEPGSCATVQIPTLARPGAGPNPAFSNPLLFFNGRTRDPAKFMLVEYRNPEADGADVEDAVAPKPGGVALWYVERNSSGGVVLVPGGQIRPGLNGVLESVVRGDDVRISSAIAPGPNRVPESQRRGDDELKFQGDATVWTISAAGPGVAAGARGGSFLWRASHGDIFLDPFGLGRTNPVTPAQHSSFRIRIGGAGRESTSVDVQWDGGRDRQPTAARLDEAIIGFNTITIRGLLGALQGTSRAVLRSNDGSEFELPVRSWRCSEAVLTSAFTTPGRYRLIVYTGRPGSSRSNALWVSPRATPISAVREPVRTVPQ